MAPTSKYFIVSINFSGIGYKQRREKKYVFNYLYTDIEIYLYALFKRKQDLNLETESARKNFLRAVTC